MKAGFLKKGRMEFPTEPSFLEKTPEEFARDAGSWRKAGRNSRKSQLTGKETEGIHEVASFLEESWKEFTKEPSFLEKEPREFTR